MDSQWSSIQKRSFTSWINAKLKQKGVERRVKNLMLDVGDGVVLIELLSLLFPHTAPPKFNKAPKLSAQKLDNLQLAFEMLQEAHVQIEFIKPKSESPISFSFKIF